MTKTEGGLLGELGRMEGNLANECFLAEVIVVMTSDV